MNIEASLLGNATRMLYQKSYYKALGTLEKLMALGTNDPETVYLCAICCFITGRYNKAMEISEEMQAKWPDDVKTNELHKHFQSKTCQEYQSAIECCYRFIQQGRMRKALKMLEKHTEITETTVLPLKIMANIYLLHNRRRKALQCYLKVLRIDASDPDALSYLTNTEVEHE